MITIDEIMECVYRSQFAASAYEASYGPGTGKLEIDMFAADGEVQALITQAIAEARADGAREMREAVAAEFDRRDDGAGTGFYDPHEPAEIVRSLPLPTGKREPVRLTDDEAMDALPDCHGASLGKTWLLSAARAIETAVLTANGLTK